MEPAEYEKLAELDTTHWWFHTLRGVLTDLAVDLALGPHARVLDAGCGSGANLAALARATGAAPFGFDVSDHAARTWKSARATMAIASINEIPLASESFDLAIAIDVLESDGVCPVTAYRELVRVVRPSGCLMIVVPAYEWMRTPEHHRAVHAVRRYTRRTLRALLDEAPVMVMRLTHVFATVFPLVAAYRLYKRATSRSSGAARSEVWRVPALANGALIAAMTAERRALRHVDMRCGSSLLAVVRKT